MKPVILFAWLVALLLGGCSWVPRAGPSASDVVQQAQPQGEILFDVVEVDERVVSTLLAQPKEIFAARFKSNSQPPSIKIAIGDTISVSIWESAAGGLFFESPPPPPSGGPLGVEPLAPETQPSTGERQNELGVAPPTGPPASAETPLARRGGPAP